MQIKSLFYGLLFLPILACSHSLNALTHTNLLPVGTPQIINKKLVKDINDNCRIDDYFSYTEEKQKEYHKKCKLSTFSSTQNVRNIFEELQKNKIVYLYQSNQFNIYLKKTTDTKKCLVEGKQLEGKCAVSPEQFIITMFIESSSKIINQLIVYSSEYNQSSMSQKTLDFYIDKQLNIWLFEHFFFEESAMASLWQHYKINNKGKFNLLDEIKCQFENGGLKLVCKNKNFKNK
ncbi:hypothetical protein JMI89_03535 [Frischella sp. Ac48]|uniref:hypothetical protein n=1 Tax=Frischella sp. Ac48 TaxID=2804531 RepID=UPI001C7DE31C|nr:hypothetical protein [Frischella sp. Ac48]MBX4132702.1 hypothetical protein [Frischella sp. Ac48]